MSSQPATSTTPAVSRAGGAWHALGPAPAVAATTFTPALLVGVVPSISRCRHGTSPLAGR